MKVSIQNGGGLRHSLFLLAMIIIIATPLTWRSTESATFVNVLPSFIVLLAGVIIKRKFQINKQHILVIAFYFVMLFSSIINTTNVSTTAITFALFVLYYIFITGEEYSVDDIKLFIREIVILSIFFALAIVLSMVFGYKYIGNKFARYSVDILGYKKNPNYVTGYILIGFSIISYFLFDGNFINKAKTILYVICIIMMTYAIFLSGTRAALLGEVIILIYITSTTLLSRGSGNNKLFVIGLLIILTVALFMASDRLASILPSFLADRMTIGNIIGDDNVRLYLWRNGLVYSMQKNPIVGVGAYGLNEYLFSGALAVEHHFHNILLQMLCEEGIIGVIIFLATVFVDNRKIHANDRKFINTISIALFFPILFQNGLYALAFWFPIIIRTILVSFSSRSNNGIIGGIYAK